MLVSLVARADIREQIKGREARVRAAARRKTAVERKKAGEKI
jgi:hypothetical protein